MWRRLNDETVGAQLERVAVDVKLMMNNNTNEDEFLQR